MGRGRWLILQGSAGFINPNLTLPSMTIHKMGRAIFVQASALALLNGATWLFQLVGLGGQRWDLWYIIKSTVICSRCFHGWGLMGKRAVAITPTSRFSNRRIDNVWWMFSLVTCTCLVSFHCLDWAFGDELWDTGGIQQLCNLIMMQPIPLKCNRIQQVCCHRMPWTQHLNLWRWWIGCTTSKVLTTYSSQSCCAWLGLGARGHLLVFAPCHILPLLKSSPCLPVLNYIV